MEFDLHRARYPVAGGERSVSVRILTPRYPDARERLTRREAPTLDVTKSDCVYFVQCTLIDSGPIKIGWVTKRSLLRQRLGSLQTGCPFLLQYVAFIPGGGPDLERYLHLFFDHLRMRGEWFAPGESLQELITGSVDLLSELGWTVEMWWQT